MSDKQKFIEKCQQNYENGQVITTIEGKIVIEEHPTNFGHIDLVNKGVSFPPLGPDQWYDSDDPNKVIHYGSSRVDYYPSDAVKGIDKNEIINKNIANIKPIDGFFKLYRYGFNKLNKPNATDEPTLSMSLFKPIIDNNGKLISSGDWFNRYFYTQLAQIIAFNYYFPEGSCRVYLDWYMLESFKKVDASTFKISPLNEKISGSNDYETIINGKPSINECYKRYDLYNSRNTINFSNACEKFLYYFVISSKIYNTTDTDDQIKKNKEADFFIYKFDGDFTETIEGKISHITNGYIGQAMRYICLRQVNYKYNNELIKRNTHYIWRDGHQNQPGVNDAEIIRSFNTSVMNSTNKIYNLIPSNIHYKAPWHNHVKCTNIDTIYVRRSAIAGVVQMINKTDNSEWFSNNVYYNSIGMIFLLDNDNKVTLKYHREKQLRGSSILEGYDYGIEEYAFDTFFKLEFFKKKNIYFNDRFSNDVIKNTDNILYKAYIILIRYLIKKKKISSESRHVDCIKEIESLRNNPPTDKDEKKWLGFILSILPTKYFIQGTIFNKFNETIFNEKINIDIIKEDIPDIKNLTWAYLNSIGINCNTPIINSGVEWCTDLYLKDAEHCPPEGFFSGFYTDKPQGLKYGIFRNPEELKQLVELIDRKQEIPLYKNILEHIPEEKTVYRGGYYQKYLKYKNKYLQLKNQI